MPEETFTIFLQPDYGVGTATSSKQYTINWESIIPKKYKKFLLKATFTSVDNSYSTMFIKVELTGLSTQIWDSRITGKSNLVAIAYPHDTTAFATDEYLYSTVASEISGITVDRPNQNILTVNLYDYAHDAVAPADYTLILQLTPIVSNP